ncbi:MAG: hypothetical protein QW815_07615 [Nitrososphaerota archaeon]
MNALARATGYKLRHIQHIVRAGMLPVVWDGGKQRVPMVSKSWIRNALVALNRKLK